VNGNPPDSFTQSLELVTCESCGGTCPNVVSGLSDPRRVPSDTGKTRGSALMRGHKRRGCAEWPRLRPSPGCDAAAQAATRARVAAVANPAGQAPAGACEMREKSGPVPRRCQAAGWWRFNTMRRRCKSKVNRSRESNNDDTSRLSSGCGGGPGLVRPAGLGRGVVAHRRALARVRRAVGLLLAHFPRSGRGGGAAVVEVDSGVRRGAVAIGGGVCNARRVKEAGAEGVGEGAFGRRSGEGRLEQCFGGVGVAVDGIELREGAREEGLAEHVEVVLA